MHPAPCHPKTKARRAARLILAGLAVALAPAPALVEYLFVTPTAKQQNRVYWLDRYTGTVGACQYQKPKDGPPDGSMRCFAPGDKARDMPSGDYDLMASNWDTEFGVFRLNRTTGEISLCFVKEADDKVICTPQAITR